MSKICGNCIYFRNDGILGSVCRSENAIDDFFKNSLFNHTYFYPYRTDCKFKTVEKILLKAIKITEDDLLEL